MIKHWTAAAFAALGALGLSGAHAEGGGFVGNTVTVEAGGAPAVSIYIAEDGTYAASDGTSGAWTFDGATLCFNDMCGPFDGSKGPGDTWEDQSWGGDGTATITITEGDAL